MTKITFTDKVNAIDPGLPAINVWDATNANEVKTVVNANDDRLITAEAEILTGWQPLGATLTYSSADSPTWVVGSSVDLTGKVQKGNRLYLEQAQALTSYFNFDNNSTDAKGILTTTNTAMTYTAGKFSNAATFNGTTSKIVITDTALAKPTGAFTVGAWVKSSTTGTYKTIFQSSSANTNFAGFKLFISGATNTMLFATGNNAGAAYTVTGSINVCDGNWHYVVGTYNNNYLQLYIDGKLDGSTYEVAPAYAATNYIRIGCKNDAGTDGDFMNGQIDDLFFINGYALDGETIFQKYLLGTAQGSGNITIKKKFIVTRVTTTQLTLYGGTDFQLANATISNPYFSQIKQPFGFDTTPDKWAVISKYQSAVTQVSPVSATWYNMGARSLVVPIGNWNVSYQTDMFATRATAGRIDINTTLSSVNNGNSDNDFRSRQILDSCVLNGTTLGKSKNLEVTFKTTYYLNYMVDNTTSNLMGSDTTYYYIKATSNYL